MSYFYISIKNKENIIFLQETVELIKEYCLKDSNKLSIVLNKKSHSNCIFDNLNDFEFQLYETKFNNYEESEKFYKSKYLVNNQDLEVLFKIYNTINIESIEELKVQVKIIYNFDFIDALQLIINLLGEKEPLSVILSNLNGEIFNQIIVNGDESQCAIIENNHIYTAKYLEGIYQKLKMIEKNETLNKYNQYKFLDKKFSLKFKKEINKI